MLKQPVESNPILIRPARGGEAQAIAALIQRAFAQYRGKLQPEASALLESADTIESAMATGTVLVALMAGRVAGCVSVQPKGDFGHAGRLAVDPPERGAGIARALMMEAEALARRMGMNRLRVAVRLVLTENRALFRSLGFVEGSRRSHPGFAHSTSIEMEKILM